MDTDSMKQLVRRYYDEMWSQGRLGFIDEHMAQDYENHDPATPGKVIAGRDGFHAFVRGYREAFPDLRFEILEQFADGNVVTSRWRASGTQSGALMGIPPTGKRADVKRHIENVYDKTGQRTRAALSIWAVENDVLQ